MQRIWERWQLAFFAVIVAIGLGLKFRLAATTYLNPDEAHHVLMTFHGWHATWREALGETHPPMLALITHAVSMVGHGEIAMRAVPILAGSLFPILICIWLRRLAGTLAGLTALFLLTLSPNLIALSAEVRSYSLAAAFVAASLLALERAFDRKSWRAMAWFDVFVCCALFSDYSVVPIAGAFGIYALIRLRGAPLELKGTWIAGQLAALALLAKLYRAQIRGVVSRTATDASSTWLASSFPHHGSELTFPFLNILKHFAYILSSTTAGAALGVAAFVGGIILLWTFRAGVERGKSRTLATLLVAATALAIIGAYAHRFPYGQTRHALVIGLFDVAGIAILIANLPRALAIAMLCGGMLLMPLWELKTQPAQQIGSDRNRKEQIFACLDYMRATIPPGAILLVDQETLLELEYYTGEDHREYPEEDSFTEYSLAGRWRLVTREWQFGAPVPFEKTLADFRRQYGSAATGSVWVLDGGFTAVTHPPDPSLPFTKAIRIFRAPLP